MKKLTKFLLVCIMILTFIVPAHAASSATDDGGTYILNGEITNTYVQGRATGTNSSNVNVTIYKPIYIRTDKATKTASNRSAMTYINYYGTSLDLFWKWKSATVKGILPSNASPTEVVVKNS